MKLDEFLDACRDAAIVDALNQTGGNRELAAEKLAISLRRLFYHLRQMRNRGIIIPSKRPYHERQG